MKVSACFEHVIQKELLIKSSFCKDFRLQRHAHHCQTFNTYINKAHSLWLIKNWMNKIDNTLKTYLLPSPMISERTPFAQLMCLFWRIRF